MRKLTGHPVVDAIAQINFEGDITPKSWYKHIRYQNKKSGERADHLAVAILADIVYWYRPFQKRDELTGEVIGWYRKFKGDVLHRSPDAFAEALGTTTRCIRESMKLLEHLGLITVILKPVKTQYGTIPNVMHIEVIPDAIAKITYRSNATENISEDAESIEKSLLRKWVTSNNEMSNIPSRNGKQATTKSESICDELENRSNEIANSSIYIDLLEINDETLHQRQEMKNDAEKTASSEDNCTQRSSASLSNNQQSFGKQTDPHDGNFSAAPALNQADNRFVAGRPQNAFKDCGLSVASDPWMETSRNPKKEFAQWVADKRYKGKSSTPLADAKSEIRNNSDRASDLWEEYQSEIATKAKQTEVIRQIPLQAVEAPTIEKKLTPKELIESDPELMAKRDAVISKLSLAAAKENARKVSGRIR